MQVGAGRGFQDPLPAPGHSATTATTRVAFIRDHDARGGLRQGAVRDQSRGSRGRRRGVVEGQSRGSRGVLVVEGSVAGQSRGSRGVVEGQLRGS